MRDLRHQKSKTQLIEMEQNDITEIDVMYTLRFPSCFIDVNSNTEPTIDAELPITVTRFGLIGVPNALSTWMMYGSQIFINENSLKNCNKNTNVYDLMIRFRWNSLILSQKVCLGW